MRWVRALFGGHVIKDQQLSEMQRIVCGDSKMGCTVGQPVNPQIGGYGLGLMEKYQPYLGGKTWLYEGGTPGYKFFYLWIPAHNTVISVAEDKSAVNDRSISCVTTDVLKILHYLPDSEKMKIGTISSASFSISNKAT